MTSPAVPPNLADRVEKFVAWLFDGYKPSIPKGPKVFNDALLGNMLFAKHEVAVIDSPVLQRLRRIKQTGLVYYVYPSATHTRFEHSLGVAALAERCFNAIRERSDIEDTPLQVDPDRSKGDLAHLRMAALLHDVGHGLCSHASEQIYKLLSDLQEFTSNPSYCKNQPGEILSYLIVTSSTFRGWFSEVVTQGCHALLDLDRISNLILGREEPDKLFLANIVSGAYDCDKLDYIARDSYYCGLALTVDLPRFLSMISTAKYATKKKESRILVLRSYVPLEQILFSKMTLYGSVYHHQKVKCLDSMLRSVVGHIVDYPEQAAVPVRGGSVSFADAVQYLYTTDDEFFWQPNGFGDKYTQGMLNRFRNRDLFVRCLEISRRTVRNWSSGRQKLIDLNKSPSALADVENEIHKRLRSAEKESCSRHDVRLSIPGIPEIKTENALIQTSKDAQVENIEKYFPLAGWTAAYAQNKWKSFVYAPKRIAAAVRDSAVSVLSEQTDLDFDTAESNRACHL
jgi:HD superfamily phosphohydrolase